MMTAAPYHQKGCLCGGCVQMGDASPPEVESANWRELSLWLIENYNRYGNFQDLARALLARFEVMPK